MSVGPPNSTDARRLALVSGVRAEALTVAWMIVEAAVAIYAGIVARSVLLTAFGADSVIELLSGGVLLWRLHAEGDRERTENVERRAAWLSAVLLVLLCLYILASSAVGLLRHVEPDASLLGIAVSAAAIVVMPLIAAWKRRINLVLQSGALRADIAESVSCAYMAACVLLGLALNWLLHWWWIEYVATLSLLFWLVHETREAFESARGESCEND
ncbi:MAG: cation transporter [Acidobacteriota bacterium]